MGSAATTPSSATTAARLRVRAVSTWRSEPKHSPTLASTSTSTTTDAVLILTTRAVRVTLTNRNYPGRCLIPVCIVPSAKSSTANRLIPFSQQATAAALSRSSINTCTPPPVHTTTISPRFTHYSLHRFRRFRPTFHQTPSSSPQRWPHEPAHLSCGIRIRFIYPCRSLCRRFRQRSPSFFRLRPHLCLASAMAVHCRCRTGPGPCPPPRLHTLVLRSKTMPPSLALLLHVFAPHLLNMGNHLPCPCIPTARPLCTPPSFRSSLKPSSTHHTQTSSRMGPLTRTLSMDVRPSTRSHT
jgi:hypothetical protein